MKHVIEKLVKDALKTGNSKEGSYEIIYKEDNNSVVVYRHDEIILILSDVFLFKPKSEPYVSYFYGKSSADSKALNAIFSSLYLDDFHARYSKKLNRFYLMADHGGGFISEMFVNSNKN